MLNLADDPAALKAEAGHLCSRKGSSMSTGHCKLTNMLASTLCVGQIDIRHDRHIMH